jgi:membrane protein implicated in regulation of membrane protease activity
MSRFLIVLGLVIAAIGVLWPVLAQLGLGRLPGDIVIQRGNFSFYFPLATCIIVSVLLSVVFWLFNR